MVKFRTNSPKTIHSHFLTHDGGSATLTILWDYIPAGLGHDVGREQRVKWCMHMRWRRPRCRADQENVITASEREEINNAVYILHVACARGLLVRACTRTVILAAAAAAAVLDAASPSRTCPSHFLRVHRRIFTTTEVRHVRLSISDRHNIFCFSGYIKQFYYLSSHVSYFPSVLLRTVTTSDCSALPPFSWYNNKFYEHLYLSCDRTNRERERNNHIYKIKNDA